MRKRKNIHPQSFGFPKSASELGLGQFFVNLKTISAQNLETLGFKTNTILDHESLTRNLATLIGEGKTLNTVSTPVRVKSDPLKKLLGHLINNIKDYLASYLKGSSKTRLILNRVHPNLININMIKWKEKVHSDNQTGK